MVTTTCISAIEKKGTEPMKNSDIYQGLRFRRPRPTVPRRLYPIGAALILFTLLWAFVPHGALYWLMLALLATLVWVASFGWRQALVVLVDVLHRLEQL